MKRMRYNILINGTLSSGSSALVAMLREYDKINVVPSEFDDFRAPGLVADQLSSYASIDFPNEISQLTRMKSILNIVKKSLPYFIRGGFGLRNRDCLDFIIRLNQLYFLSQLNKDLKMNISYDEKIRLSNEWIGRVGAIGGFNKEYALFNQPIMSSSDIDIWRKVFHPYKLIYVYRNPKDQLADIIKREVLFKPYGAPYMNFAGVNIEAIFGRNRRGALLFQIEAIKRRLLDIDVLKKVLSPEEFLLIDYEGLVNDYGVYRKAIENFIGRGIGSQRDEYKYFNPLKSKVNIGFSGKYLCDDDIKYLSELEDWYTKTRENNRIALIGIT